ncbi:MAG: hypothetical protein AAF551_13640 [Bacteroidota bacterium]
MKRISSYLSKFVLLLCLMMVFGCKEDIQDPVVALDDPASSPTDCIEYMLCQSNARRNLEKDLEECGGNGVCESLAFITYYSSCGPISFICDDV